MGTMNNIRGIIFDLQKYSIRDGPGIRTTVFFKGCPLGCAWCQNPESLKPGPEKISARSSRLRPRRYAEKPVTVAEVMKEIKQDRIFYDLSGGGATFSGGEPLMQPDFLIGLLRSCRRHGIRTAVDTSGYTIWPVLDGVRRFTDLFLYDLKLMDPALHRRYAGFDNAPILDNLKRLDERGSRVVIRVPVIPGISDSPMNIRNIGRFVAGLRKVRRLDLLPYNTLCKEKYHRLGRPYRLGRLKPPTAGSLNRIRDHLSNFGLEVEIGG